MAMDITTLGIAVDSRQVKQADKHLDNLSNTSSKTEKNVNKLSKSSNALGNALKAIGIGYIAKELAQVADAYSLMEGRIRLVTASQRELLTVQDELLNISQNARTGLESTTDLYSRLARSTQGLGVSQREVLNVTEAISKSFIVSGASAESANAAIIQLGQGLAAGTLRGDELNSVMEQSPRLAEAIAKGMGVTIGQLRTLGAEGKITAETVFNAIKDQGGAIDAEFKKMPLTIGQSLTQVENAWTTLIGEFDKETGASGSIAGAFSYISNLILENKDYIIEVAKDTGRVFQLMGTGILLVANDLKIGMLEATKYIGNGINWIADAWDTMAVSMKNVFKAMIDFVGESFYSGINYMLKLLSDFINSVSGSIGGVFELLGQENPFGEINLSIGEYTSSINMATKSSSDLINLDWTESNLTEAYNAQNKILEVGKGLWDDIVNNTTDTSHAVADLNEKTDRTVNSTQKLSKEALKAQKEAEKAAKKAEKELMEWNDRFAEDFYNSFNTMLSGDLKGAFSRFFSDISNTLMKPFMDNISSSLSSSLSGIFGGGSMLGISGLGNFLTGGILGIAGSLLGGLFSGGTVSSQDIKAAQGITEVNDKGVQNLLEYLNKEIVKNVANTKKIVDGINAMSQVTKLLGYDFSKDIAAVPTSSRKTNDYYETISYRVTTDMLGVADILAGQGFTGTYNTSALKTYDTLVGGSGQEIVDWASGQISIEMGNQLATAYKEGITSAIAAADILGITEDEFIKLSEDWSAALENIDVAGKSPEEIADLINSAVGQNLNSLADLVVGDFIDGLQMSGETSFEAMVRIATGYEQVNLVLADIGMSFDEVTQASVRASDAIIQASGGIENFANNMNSFIDNFYTGEEKVAIMTKNFEYAIADINSEFKDANIQMPKSKAEFRELIESVSPEENPELFASLLALADDFNEIAKAQDAISDSTTRMIEEVADAWLGNLSYLSLQQKADFASGYLAIASTSGGAIDTVEAARVAAETALRTTSTREEYIPVFERYIKELEGKDEESTLDDVVGRLDTLIEKVTDLEETTGKAV